MRKLISLLLCGAMIFCLASCGSEAGSTAQDISESAESTDTAGEETVSISEEIITGLETGTHRS